MESGIDASRRGPMPARTFELTPPRYIALRGEGREEDGASGTLQRLSPLTPRADLPNSRAGCNADDLSSLTSLAPSDKDGNVVLKLVSRSKGLWLPLSSLGTDANVSVDLYYARDMASG